MILKSKAYVLFLLLCLSALSSRAQSLEIIKTDASNYPEVEVFIKLNGDSIEQQAIKIFEQDIERKFSVDTLAVSGMVTGGNILFVSAQDIINDSLSYHKQALFSVLKKEHADMRINFASFCAGKDSLAEIKFLAPDFSDNIQFFNDNYNYLQRHPVITESKSALCKSIQEILNFKSITENKQGRTAVIFISKKMHLPKLKTGCLGDIAEHNIPVYFLLSDSVDYKTESNLITLSTTTGGLYTIINQHTIKTTLSDYLYDISLRKVSAGDHIFILKFISGQNRIRNEFTINYHDKEFQTFYIKTRNSKRFSVNYYLIIILVLLLMLFAILILGKNRFRQASPELTDKPASKKSGNLIKRRTYAELSVFSKSFSKRFVLTAHETTVGRNQNNSIAVPDTTMSAFHAKISFENNKYYIEDLDSTNGIFVNGQRITKTELKNKDFIKLGAVSARFNLI